MVGVEIEHRVELAESEVRMSCLDQVRGEGGSDVDIFRIDIQKLVR